MTTSSTQLSLIVDDADTDVFSFNSNASHFLAGNFTSGLELDPSFVFYQSTSHFANITNLNNATFVDITFNGTSIAIVGTSAFPINNLSQTYMVSIDGGAPYQTGYGDLNPAYKQWYQSPALSEGPHTISLTGIDFPASIDYAVITTGNPLSSVVENNQTVIVDDNDSGIVYSALNWTETNNFNFDAEAEEINSTVLAYGNSTHESNTVGSSFNYSFVGDGILSVFGIFDWRSLGSINLTFTLDGTETPMGFDVTSDDQNFKLGAVQPNFQYYQGIANATSDGTHTLVVDVVDTQNLTFVVDYITFAPTSAPSVGDSTHSKKSRVGDIVGGVLGGVGLLVLSFVAFDCFLRMKRKNTSRRRSFNYPFRTGPGFSTANDFPLSPTDYARKDASLAT